MDIQVVTLFPAMFAEFMRLGVVGRACRKGLFSLRTIDIRDFAADPHRTVDDRPFGGGAGMVMKPDVFDRAILHCKEARPDARTVFLTPQGRTLNQALVRELSGVPEFILVCGRYQGIDQRVIDKHADDELSIGDYVLSGGEIPAMVAIDAVARMLEGVVGKHESVESDSFWKGLLAPPVYTRPAEWEGRHVPDVLLQGDHERIRAWRRDQSVQATRKKRPELASGTRRGGEESC